MQLPKRKKTKEAIAQLRRLVNAPLAQSGSIASLNMVDMYLLSKEREHLLNTLQDRAPHATANLISDEDWQNKFNTPEFQNAYTNFYVGETAEVSSIDFLAEKGIHATQFASKTAKDNDLVADDGTLYSVKSYSTDNLSHLENRIAESDASNYTVNSEAYEKLQSQGKIEEFAANGISIENGGYSHQESLERAQDHIIDRSGHSISPIFDSALDDVPIVGAIAVSLKIGSAFKAAKTGRLSAKEALGDVITDVGKIGAGMTGAVAGAVAGASLGSILPPVGTIIGAFIGTIAGASVSRAYILSGRYRNKWPASHKFYNYLFRKHKNGLPQEALQNVENRFFAAGSFTEELEETESRMLELEASTQHGFFRKEDTRLIFLEEVVKTLKAKLVDIEILSRQFFPIVRNYAIAQGIEAAPDDLRLGKRIAAYVFGATLAENSDWLLPQNKNLAEMKQKYLAEKSHSPNNPQAKLALTEKDLQIRLFQTVSAPKTIQLSYSKAYKRDFYSGHTDVAGQKRTDQKVAAAVAAGSGATASLGIASIVASLGSASTGTAISTLSGAAATASILAVLGGGPIAAGGGGVALGTLVLIGIFIVTTAIIYFLIYRRRRKKRAEK